MNKWEVTDELKAKFVPMLREYFAKLENMTEEQMDELYKNDRLEELAINLSDTGINPYQLRELLETEFNYEYIDMDRNGCEMDFWIYMHRKDEVEFVSGCHYMVIAGCGITFTLSLKPESMEW